MATSLDDAYQHCMDVVYEADRDRFLASLFVPSDKRPQVLALRAFDLKISKVRSLISEPLPGEIRLQWWRDGLTGGSTGDTVGHPVALALLDTIQKHQLPLDAFTRLLDARIFDLYDDPMPSLNDLDGYAGDTASTLYQLTALILDPEAASTTAEASGHAGVLETVVSVLRNAKFHLSRGQIFLPQDMLEKNDVDLELLRAGQMQPGLKTVADALIEKSKDHLGALKAAHVPDNVMPAFVGVSLFAKNLELLAKTTDVFEEPPQDLPQWRRQWILWRAARRGKF